MRNLKRALSLALAAVMVIGMMVVGAGAVSIDDFSDKDEIVNKEAVTTMVSLGVINGKDDGSYDPTGIVTRAEMAKLIAVTLNGGKDPTLGAITANFTDTAGHWAEPYIAYVSELGIIDGRGDGTFGPNDQVTGAQAAKMILTMLGYRSDIEGFTGANWAINVQTKGNDINLFADMNINPDEGLTRDDTAQMLYNGVQSWMVEYRNLEGSYDGIVYPQPLNGDKDNSTVLIEKFKVVKVEGVVVANDVFAVPGFSVAANGRVRLEDTNTYNTTGGNGVAVQRNYNGVYSVDIPNEMVGTRIVIYVQFKNALAPNATDSTVIGTPISSDKNTIATTAERMKDINAVRDFLSDNDLSLANARNQAASSSDAGYYVGTLTFTKDDTVPGTSVSRAFAATGSTKEKGIEFKFIDHDDDGVVDYIFRTQPTMAKVTVYDETNEKMTIAGLGSVDFSDIANPEDVAKDDMVLYYLVNETYYLEQVETVSGEVSAYSDANKTLTMDGTAYAQSAIRAEISSTDLTNLAIAGNEDGMDFVGNTYTFYLDSHGNVVAWVLGEESVGNYALVLGADVSGNTNFKSAKVKLLMADGSTGTYNVNLLASANRFELPGSNSAKENDMASKLDSNGMDNDIVVYTIGSDGTVTLGNPAPSTSKTYKAGEGQDDTNVVARGTGSYTLDIGNDSVTTNDVTVKVNDSTIFFIRNKTKSTADDTYSVVQGVSNLPASKILKSDSNGDATVEAAVWTLTDANYNVAKAVFVDGEYKGTANYVYVVDTYTGTKKTDSGELVYTYPVVFENGEKGELNFGTNTVPDGVVLEYTIGNNGVAEYVTDQAGNLDDTRNGVVATYGSRNNLTVVDGDGFVEDAGSYTVAADAKIWNVENDPVSTTLTSDISVAFVLNSDGQVKTAFVKDTNVTDFSNLVLENSITGLSLKYSPVYSGFDAVIQGGTSGKEITYVVTYDNGKSDAAKTATFNASGEAAISVPKNAAKIAITAYSGSTTPTPTPGSVVTIDSTVNGWTFYNAADNSQLTKGNDPVNGTNVEIPSGVTSVYIQNSTWTAGSFIGFGTKAYTVTAGKSIEVAVADLGTSLASTDFKPVYSISVPANVTVTENGGGTVYTDANGVVYLEGTATAKLTGLAGKYYTTNAGTSYTATTTNTVSVSSANVTVDDGYYAIAETVVVTNNATTSLPSATFTTGFTGKVTTPAAVTSKNYIKDGGTVVVTITAGDTASTSGAVNGVIATSTSGATLAGTGATAAKVWDDSASLTASTSTVTLTVTVDVDDTLSGDITLTATLSDG